MQIKVRGWMMVKNAPGPASSGLRVATKRNLWVFSTLLYCAH